MLNRRILRIKAFQTLYSAVVTRELESPMSLADAQSQLEQSCESVRDLYIYMLGMVQSLTQTAAERISSLGRKMVLTEEEQNPNTRFADNALAALLAEDTDFQKVWKKKKYSWDQYDLLMKSLLNTISERDYFKQYMTSETCSLADDCRLFCRIYEEELLENEDLGAILEDQSIWWEYDLGYALMECCQTFRALGKGIRWSLPPVYQSEILAAQGKKVDSDKLFVNRLLRASFAGYDKYSAMVAEYVRGWDKDRLVFTDMLLLVCCLAEVATFPEIPVNVSINEYVEISKYFGIQKSSVFVNGLADKIIQKLREDGAIVKNQ